MKLSEAVRLFLLNYNPKTAIQSKYYFDRFLGFIGDKKINKIKIPDIDRFRQSLNYKPSVNQRSILLIKWLFKFLNVHYGIGIPYMSIEIPKYFSGSYDRIKTEDLVRVYKSFDNSLLGLRNLSICKFLYDTGIRISEIEQFTRDDVKDEVEIITAKTDKKRVVFLTEETQKILKKYLSARLDEMPCLFATIHRPYKCLSARDITTYMKFWGRKIGIKIHPHMFRKTIASDLCDKSNGNVYMVKEYLGHESIKSTEVYLKSDKLKLKKWYDKTLTENEELNFCVKKDGDINLELSGWCEIHKAKILRSAINKAINDVLGCG